MGSIRAYCNRATIAERQRERCIEATPTFLPPTRSDLPISGATCVVPGAFWGGGRVRRAHVVMRELCYP